MDPDPYLVLGVPRDADLRAIKRAFRALARRFHPDVADGRAADEARFREARAAYDLLADPERRDAYDVAARSGAERGLRDAALEAIFRGLFGEDGEGPRDQGTRRFEGRVSGSRRIEVDAVLSRAEARYGTRVPFRFHLGPRPVDAEIAIPPGVRTGERLVCSLPVEPGLVLKLIIHIEIGD